MKRNLTLILISVALVLTALLLPACGDDAQVTNAPPLENNTVAKLGFTSIHYMTDILAVEQGVEFTDPADVQTILALFNNVAFDDVAPGQMQEIYAELIGAQYMVLDGAGTLMLGENGRAVLSEGTYSIVSEEGAVSPDALRQVIAELVE